VQPCASYAELLYQALKKAPGKTMELCDIYAWFREETCKVGKGLEGSIRHNLSMNAARLPPFPRLSSSLNFIQAFEKVGVHRSAKWCLTEKAVREGVVATTRFRHKPTKKLKRHAPNRDPNRQASGAKGGRARAARVKNRLELPACSLPPHHTPDVNIGYNTTPEAGALGGLLSAYPYSSFSADTLSFTGGAYSHPDFSDDGLSWTNQVYLSGNNLFGNNLFGHSATLYQPSALEDEWDWLGDV
jgi:hypothetical protein